MPASAAPSNSCRTRKPTGRFSARQQNTRKASGTHNACQCHPGEFVTNTPTDGPFFSKATEHWQSQWHTQCLPVPPRRIRAEHVNRRGRFSARQQNTRKASGTHNACQCHPGEFVTNTPTDGPFFSKATEHWQSQWHTQCLPVPPRRIRAEHANRRAAFQQGNRTLAEPVAHAMPASATPSNSCRARKPTGRFSARQQNTRKASGTHNACQCHPGEFVPNTPTDGPFFSRQQNTRRASGTHNACQCHPAAIFHKATEAPNAASILVVIPACRSPAILRVY